MASPQNSGRQFARRHRPVHNATRTHAWNETHSRSAGSMNPGATPPWDCDHRSHLVIRTHGHRNWRRGGRSTSAARRLRGPARPAAGVGTAAGGGPRPHLDHRHGGSVRRHRCRDTPARSPRDHRLAGDGHMADLAHVAPAAEGLRGGQAGEAGWSGPDRLPGKARPGANGDAVARRAAAGSPGSKPPWRARLLPLAALRSRTTHDVRAAADELGLRPRRVWALLRQLEASGNDVAAMVPRHTRTRATRLQAPVEAVIAHAIQHRDMQVEAMAELLGPPLNARPHRPTPPKSHPGPPNRGRPSSTRNFNHVDGRYPVHSHIRWPCLGYGRGREGKLPASAACRHHRLILASQSRPAPPGLPPLDFRAYKRDFLHQVGEREDGVSREASA